ncbi:M10 family metallopeptidase C-terminal domain-containing protein [Methylobacterium radiodurans]|uniref:Calcium-binding protein n=1 Tax=Methylobacterium radiodurans TaxID=2202828 RepID=A0A2U8VPH1_9HYPH|nr:M10 family metallopeptidase C-terminal domain-containing protein [Methylobacterium radiodurans]AWN35450.1 calcium-binding protein [Methylobacterium radiodurans]
MSSLISGTADALLDSITAANPALAAVARLAASLPAAPVTGGLRSVATLGAADGCYYNAALKTLVVYKAGVLLDGIDFRGVSVRVETNNVTVTRSAFDAAAGMAAITGVAGTSGLTVTNSTFDGLKLDRAYNDFIIAQGRNTTITGNRFLNAPSDAVYIESGTVANNYFSGGGYQTGAHADAIWVGKTTGPVTITGNLIDWRTKPDAKVETNNAVRVTAEMGATSDVTVSGNVLLGGAYTVAVSELPYDKGTISNVRVTNNVVSAGLYGPLDLVTQPPGLVYTGNANAAGLGLSLAAATGPGVAELLAGTRAVTGTAGADALVGNAGRDFIQGGGGQDWVSAGAGDDVIEGGAGRDYLAGGAGKDVFLYRGFDVGRDLISDFEHGSDRIDLAELPGAPAQAGAWSWLGSERFTGAAWQLRSVATATGTTLLQLDADGDQRVDLEIEFSGQHSFSAADFILGTAASAPSAPIVTAPIVTAPIVTAPIAAEPVVPALPLVLGTDGNDIITRTGSEAVRVVAGAGGDSIRTGSGDDVIVGQGGKDIIVTGAGRDRIVYEQASDSTVSARDYITDFEVGRDLIDLSALSGSAPGLPAQLDWIGGNAFSGRAGELRATGTSAGSTLIQADLNGDRTADFAIELAGQKDLTAASFVL